jgi:hypothetical protein
VNKAVLAIFISNALSGLGQATLNNSKNLNVSYLAVSYPSQIILG